MLLVKFESRMGKFMLLLGNYVPSPKILQVHKK